MVASHYGLYDYDVITVKKIGDNYRIIYNPALRVSGLEDDQEHTQKGFVNDFKLDNNLSRARSKVSELVLCNEWDYFVTFTLSPEKIDRYDLKGFYKKFSRFLLNYNRICTEEEKVKYIFVPEKHEDGAWHIHGFLKGIRKKDIYTNRFGYLGWKQYEAKFGFISFDNIRDNERVASYIQKYITKNVLRSVSEIGAHIYYASKGLKTAEIVYRGQAKLHDGQHWDYIHPDGLCCIKTVSADVSLDSVLDLDYFFSDRLISCYESELV